MIITRERTTPRTARMNEYNPYSCLFSTHPHSVNTAELPRKPCWDLCLSAHSNSGAINSSPTRIRRQLIQLLLLRPQIEPIYFIEIVWGWIIIIIINRTAVPVVSRDPNSIVVGCRVEGTNPISIPSDFPIRQYNFTVVQTVQATGIFAY